MSRSFSSLVMVQLLPGQSGADNRRYANPTGWVFCGTAGSLSEGWLRAAHWVESGLVVTILRGFPR